MNTQSQTFITTDADSIPKLNSLVPKSPRTGVFRTLIGVLLLAVGLTVAAPQAWAQSDAPASPGTHRPNPGTIKIFLQIAQEAHKTASDVNLSDAQRAAIENYLKQTAPQAQVLRETLKTKHEALRNQLLNNPGDTARLDQLAGDLAVTESQLTHLRVMRMAGVAEQLTPAQRQRIAQGITTIQGLVEQLHNSIDSGRIFNALSAQ